MNSTERKRNRYLRRKMKRESKYIKRADKYSNIDDIFVFHKVMDYADKCTLNVKWKRSTKMFMLHEFTNIATACYNTKNDCYKVGDTYHFTINERGKKRNITAPHIHDRLIHKIISNEILVPIYTPLLIYDNGASQIDKGFLFALKRVRIKLNKFYSNYKDAYVVVVDFSKFFPSCSHDVIHDIHKKYIRNERTIKIIEDYLFIEDGISLGVELAQREAAMLPTILDKYVINNALFIERYMDDSLFICDSYNNALKILNEYKLMAKSIDVKINESKTKILKITDKIKYCKWIYKIQNNKLIMYPYKKTIYRQRRKLRKMYNMFLNNEISIVDVNTVRTCFNAYLNNGNSHKYIHYLNSRYQYKKKKFDLNSIYIDSNGINIRIP